MFERVTGIIFDELVYYIEDAHIYEMQLTHAQRLIDTDTEFPHVFPEIHFTEDAPTENILAFRPEHFIVKDYVANPWFKIPTPI
jgi:thymidylate synthase